MSRKHTSCIYKEFFVLFAVYKRAHSRTIIKSTNIQKCNHSNFIQYTRKKEDALENILSSYRAFRYTIKNRKTYTACCATVVLCRVVSEELL